MMRRPRSTPVRAAALMICVQVASVNASALLGEALQTCQVSVIPAEPLEKREEREAHMKEHISKEKVDQQIKDGLPRYKDKE